jgi:formylglycine-generating enzyme required for sulfatase activity
MRRWFLSYNSQDFQLAERLVAEISRKDAKASIFFAPKSLRPGTYWMPTLAKEIAEATAFVLLIGKNGLGPWQTLEYQEAIDRSRKEPDFAVVPVLLDRVPAPGLPFLRQLHWIITPDPASELSVAQVIDAASGGGAPPGELWRHTAPYRGLSAMTESDAEFFFGRGRETVEVIGALATTPDRLSLLLGNSGVGKSSLAQAGVLAALMRQDWSEVAAEQWPLAFDNSRGWCFLRLKPDAEPVRALVEPFLWTWQFDALDPKRAELLSSWAKGLIDDKVGLRDLLDATQARYRDELHQPAPPAFFIYIDQGEQLYVRAAARERHRFSEILAQTLPDPRLRTMMSMRPISLASFRRTRRFTRPTGKLTCPHDVTIAKPFAVSKFELTFDEWDACAAHGDCDPHVSASGWGRGRQPAINVSWDDTQIYVKWLSRITGKEYRLLSEAEQEYAARAGSQTAYPWGDDIKLNDKVMANCNGCGGQWDNRQPAPVGSFAANLFGLYDMVGNVAEWTADCYNDSYQGAPADGSPWTSGNCSRRVVRGGSWQLKSDNLRSAFRNWGDAVFRGSRVGFRVARTLLTP